MTTGIIGKKLGMTQIFDAQGRVVPVTVIEAGPCTIGPGKKGQSGGDEAGQAKGRGFAGVVKRWGFKGGGASHGSMHHRAPGSIGGSSWPSRVFKNMKMGGHYGNERVTVLNLRAVTIRTEQNLLVVRGAVPGGESGRDPPGRTRGRKSPAEEGSRIARWGPAARAWAAFGPPCSAAGERCSGRT